jgi:hypothetical protein
MSDWLQDLPLAGRVLMVFGAAYLVTAVIYGVVMALAVGERARAFKGVSAGMLPPLGIIFGLLVAFDAAQVWSDMDRAHVAVVHEASALRTVVLLAATFPGEPEACLRALVRRHIDDAVTREWPNMARKEATLQQIPAALAEALHFTLTLTPRGAGQEVAQREIVDSLKDALEGRRQRLLISRSSVNWIKWAALLLEAICALLAIAIVHSDNRATAAIAMAIFATAVAVCVVLIASHHPFRGEFSVGPEMLLEVRPEGDAYRSVLPAGFQGCHCFSGPPSAAGIARARTPPSGPETVPGARSASASP